MLTRRLILKGFASTAALLPFSPVLALQSASSKRVADYIKLNENLLRGWCEGMLRHQMNAPNRPELHGGLWSPADLRVLGRCGDAVYPFLKCASITGDEKYIDAAEAVTDWSLHNVSQDDGSWLNEVNGYWKGITVFSSIALAQALHFHGGLIRPVVQEQWLDRLQSAARWMRSNIDINYSNINYPIAAAYAMVLMGRLLSSEEYRDYGKDLANQAMAWFTPKDGFLYGEGRKHGKSSGQRTPKGCYPVDLGYNVEESLPSLVQFALLEDDYVMQKKLVDALRVHLDFMLPDGSWDNSWGMRNYKWTWWGSRTTDGCAPGYALMAHHDPHFLEAAIRNTELLKRSTHKGLLYAGAHLYTRGLPPSIHHTFCHAKSLAQVLDGVIPPLSVVTTTLPRESNQGLQVYDDIATNTVSLEPWYATFTAYDLQNKRWSATHPTGGAMSMLWHRRAGPLVAASMGRYLPIEKMDMARATGQNYTTLTPRLELFEGGRPASNQGGSEDSDQIAVYSNIYDVDAQLVSEQDGPSSITVVARASIVDEHQKSYSDQTPSSVIRYTFSDDWLEIEIKVHHLSNESHIEYSLPIISDSSELVNIISGKEISLEKSDCVMRLTASRPIIWTGDTTNRIFNHVPGFQALSLRFNVSNGLRLRLEVI